MKKKLISLLTLICFLLGAAITTGCMPPPHYGYGHQKEAPPHKHAPQKPGSHHHGGRR